MCQGSQFVKTEKCKFSRKIAGVNIIYCSRGCSVSTPRLCNIFKRGWNEGKLSDSGNILSLTHISINPLYTCIYSFIYLLT